jgi:glycosyltransferase involved in cell wall biosynthesis
MRIALITTSWPAHNGDPSGHFVQAEARELERAGHTVVVVRPEVGGAFGWPGVGARVRERPWRALDAMRWVASARRQVAGLQVGRVVAHWAVPCAWPIAGGSLGAELTIVSHGGDVRLLLALPAGLREPIVAALARRAESWRFVSKQLADSLASGLTRSTRARVEAIAQVRAASLEPLDVREAVAQRRRDLGGARVAVSVGRLIASKRVDRAIEHVAKGGRAEADGKAVDALVVVGDGPERERLEKLAKRRGVAAHFVGTVTRHEALSWMGAAEYVIHASESEGLSTVVREAEGLGVQVVAIGEE